MYVGANYGRAVSCITFVLQKTFYNTSSIISCARHSLVEVVCLSGNFQLKGKKNALSFTIFSIFYLLSTYREKNIFDYKTIIELIGSIGAFKAPLDDIKDIFQM